MPRKKQAKNTRTDLALRLGRFPRTLFAHLPTPLEYLPRLTDHLGGPKIYVKRDDCTGLATGGNKTRKLEFVVADAIRSGATCLITQGAVQSNHARQTAAVACKFGLKCELLLEHRVMEPDLEYVQSGNVFLDHLFGARVRFFSKGTDMNLAMSHVAQEYVDQGEVPYVIPGGASNAIGALGYVNCVRELLVQIEEMQLDVSHLVHATGSAGTQAGLLVGLKACNSSIALLGIGVNATREQQEERVLSLCKETAALLELDNIVASDDVVANCDYIGPGYGCSTNKMVDAVKTLARLEGLLFDPVYSGKALAGMIDLIDKGHFDNKQSIVFLHTGGSVGLFAYRRNLLSYAE